MSIDYDALAYEMPWRPNYEARAACAWAGAAGVALGVNVLTAMPPEPFYWMAGISVAMGGLRLPKAFQLKTLQKHLNGRPLEFMQLKTLQTHMSKRPDEIWLGYGFDWENRHAQRAFEILKRDMSSVIEKKKKKKGSSNHIPMGVPWIHGLEPKEVKIYLPIEHSEGHVLLVGTTGSGKTRALDALISQSIVREEAVIIIDPKGDKELRDNARRACEALGQPERFVSFHPAFPEESARIDMLRNFSRPTELASRIAALIPSESGIDPFTSFGWMALNNIIQGLLIVNARPSLIAIRRYMEGGIFGLVVQTIHAYAERVLDNAKEKMSPYVKSGGNPEKLAANMMRFYYAEVQPYFPNQDLEGLLMMCQHDKAHFGKMIATLLPVLNMLTSGSLGDLLSPDSSDTSDNRPITDNTKIINTGQVLYVGLDSLSDSMVGSAIGSLFLSDMTSVAGGRYNYGVNNRPVNVYVDEAAEVINDPFIQLLNKGRGALIRLIVATQTFADFAARLGSKDKALQVLGNVNNKIALRVTDTETQAFLTESWPKTRVKYVMRTQGQNTQGDEPILHGGNQGERLMEEEADIFPPQLLGMLPNLEFMAHISGGRLVKGRLPILTA
ncbi:conjugative transfer system coupling protein TraD [Eoetvoesiella caeni]